MNQPLMRKTYSDITSVLKGMVVFAFFFFVILAFYNGPSLAILPPLAGEGALWVLCAATATAAITLLAISFAPHAFASHLPRTFVMGSCLLLPMLANAFAQQLSLIDTQLALPLTVSSWSLFGVALALIASACAEYLYCTCFNPTPLVIGIGACVGTALFAFLALLQDTFICLIIVAIVSVAGCVASIVFSRTALRNEDSIAQRRHESRIQRGRMSAAAMFSTGTQVVVLGYMLATPHLDSPFTISQVFCMGCLVAALLFVFTSVKLHWVFDLQGICQLTMPVVLAALVLSHVLGGIGSTLCYALIVVALSYHYFIYWQDSICTSRDSIFAQFVYYARSHSAVFAAAVLGICMHMAAILAPAGTLGSDAENLTSSLLVVALCIAFLVYALTTHPIGTAAEAPMAQGACANREASDPAGATPEAPSESLEEASTSLDERCAELSARFGLTERESEVFALLAKGRNAEHIMGALSISRSTAKSHIASIYRKMGVHRQQELITFVDVGD